MNAMHTTDKYFMYTGNESLYEINGLKQQARKQGYTDGDPVNVTMLNDGHIVEVAICHLLGIVQQTAKYKLSCVVGVDLDNRGIDILLDTTYGTRAIQLKYKSNESLGLIADGVYGLIFNIKSCTITGVDVITTLLRCYDLPIPDLTDIDYTLNYVWKKYTKNLK